MNRIPLLVTLISIFVLLQCTSHVAITKHNIPEIQEIELCAFPPDGGSFYRRFNRNGKLTYHQSGFGEKIEMTKSLNSDEIQNIWECLKNLDSRYFADTSCFNTNVKGTSQIIFYSNSRAIGHFTWVFGTNPSENTMNKLLINLRKYQ